jgi:hypothetical protein
LPSGKLRSQIATATRFERITFNACRPLWADRNVHPECVQRCARLEWSSASGLIARTVNSDPARPTRTGSGSRLSTLVAIALIEFRGMVAFLELPAVSPSGGRPAGVFKIVSNRGAKKGSINSATPPVSLPDIGQPSTLCGRAGPDWCGPPRHLVERRRALAQLATGAAACRTGSARAARFRARDEQVRRNSSCLASAPGARDRLKT